ncbi:MAG: M6 family metalloprotease domain-containing protein [Bacteroidia bacterium]
MKKLFLLLVAVSFLTFKAFSQRSNCASSPYPVTITQTDGSSITYKIIGNEAVHYFETEDGYTILPNKSGIFEYAILNSSGNLVCSGIKATNSIKIVLQKNATIKKHLRYSDAQVFELQTAFLAQNAMDFQLNKNLGEFPSLGVRKICVLLVDFADEQAPYPISNFDNLLNQNRYNGTGSFKDAFMEYSFGQFTPNSDVYGWFRASLPRASYGRNNPDGSQNPNYMANVRALVTEAIMKADSAGVDFSQYDNDNDGDVDGLMIFQAGFGAEQGLNGYIWSHRSTISTVMRDGKAIRNYCINPSKRNWGGQVGMVGIGVASHEFGHILGLPDLYDTQQNSSGTGNWGLMGGGPWLNQERTPCHFEPWCKIQLSWLNPIVINQTGTYNLTNSADSNIVYRVNTPNPNEYFLLENKQRKKFDAFTPGRGLAIWHINTLRTNLYPGSNTVNTDTARYGVGLKQADGLRELERNVNRGNAGDLYPGTTNNRTFNDNSNPDSKLHPNSQGIKITSNVAVTNITQNPDSTITFSLGNRAVASFNANIITGCAPLTVTFSNQSAFANSFRWNFGNGQTSNKNNPEPVTFTNSGTYTVWLIALDSANNPADSSSITITAQPSPKASFITERLDSNLFRFTNTSQNSDYILWRFGSNQTSTSQNPSVRLTTSEDMQVRLIAYTFAQCSDTAFNTLQFWPVGMPLVEPITDFNAYPNPFKNELTIDFQSKNQSDVLINIISIDGKVVMQTLSNNVKFGSNQININTQQLDNGVYIVSLKQDNFIKNLKVICSNK